jgi:hypothetical protein
VEAQSQLWQANRLPLEFGHLIATLWGQPFWAAAALSGGVAVYQRFLSL